MSEKNDTGLAPVDYNCVVRLDDEAPHAQRVTEGGVHLPDSHVDRQMMARTTATLLAVGGNAFKDWDGRRPEPGDTVVVKKYGGQYREADPSDPVRIVRDKEIIAIFEGQAEPNWSPSDSPTSGHVHRDKA